MHGHRCQESNQPDIILNERRALEAGEAARRQFLQRHPNMQERRQPKIEDLGDTRARNVDPSHQRFRNFDPLRFHNVHAQRPENQAIGRHMASPWAQLRNEMLRIRSHRGYQPVRHYHNNAVRRLDLASQLHFRSRSVDEQPGTVQERQMAEVHAPRPGFQSPSAELRDFGPTAELQDFGPAAESVRGLMKS